MSRGDCSICIIGSRCEVNILGLVLDGNKNLNERESNELVEKISPRVFALVQYQANRELNIRSDYFPFDASKFGASIQVSEDENRLVISKGKNSLVACLGSNDIVLNGNRIKLKSPVLLSLTGQIEVTKEIENLIALFD